MPYTLLKRFYPIAIGGGLSFLPLVSGAQALTNLLTLVDNTITLIEGAIIIVFLIAVLVFSWGIVKYITAAGDPAKLKEARGFLFWGIIGIFVLAALFGLVQFIGTALGISTTGGGVFKIPDVTK